MSHRSESREFHSLRPWVPDTKPPLEEAALDQSIAELRQRVTVGTSTDRERGLLWQQLGMRLRQRNHYDAALWSLEAASVLIPLSHAGQMALAECYVDAGYLEAARAIYRYLAGAIRVDTQLLESLSDGLGRVGEKDLALDVCREAAQRLPRTAGPLLGIAYYLRRLRRPAAIVLPYLERAFKLAPENLECRISLAWILHGTGRSAEGADLLACVQIDEFECVRSLTMMHRVLEAAAEFSFASACKYRLDSLAAQRLRERS
jgi:tetratricopeptide (TPR) repeat protein